MYIDYRKREEVRKPDHNWLVKRSGSQRIQRRSDSKLDLKRLRLSAWIIRRTISTGKASKADWQNMVKNRKVETVDPWRSE
jgi:hypothetical protein